MSINGQKTSHFEDSIDVKNSHIHYVCLMETLHLNTRLTIFRVIFFNKKGKNLSKLKKFDTITQINHSNFHRGS